MDLGPLPGESEIAAYHRRDTGEHLFVLETTTALPPALGPLLGVGAVGLVLATRRKGFGLRRD